MPLVDVDISIIGSDLPEDVDVFLREADSRVGRFVQDSPVRAAGFVPSDFETVYYALRAIAEANIASGSSFCEWGSGFGVVASLAAMLGFQASGIEIEEGLVDAAQRLSGDFGLPVDFIQGSFVPSGAEPFAEQALADTTAEFFWLVTDADDAYEELGLEPDDFDVIFAYPWPGEEGLIAGLFERYAAQGALLLMYNQFNSVSLQRKVAKWSGDF